MKRIRLITFQVLTRTFATVAPRTSREPLATMSSLSDWCVLPFGAINNRICQLYGSWASHPWTCVCECLCVCKTGAKILLNQSLSGRLTKAVRVSFHLASNGRTLCHQCLPNTNLSSSQCSCVCVCVQMIGCSCFLYCWRRLVSGSVLAKEIPEQIELIRVHYAIRLSDHLFIWLWSDGQRSERI